MANETSLISISDAEIQAKIRTAHGIQVVLDRDLALLYGVDTGQLNRQVKRNIERFPSDFMFQLSKEDMENLKCQFGMSSWGGDRRLPFAFTETGVAMLSGVLRSKTAIDMNIRIIRAFVAMRKALASMNPMLVRIEDIERRQIMDQSRNEARFEVIFEKMSEGAVPNHQIFYQGQLWDACSLVEKLIAKAKTSILLIDSWVDDGTLDMLSKKRKGVAVTLVASKRGNRLAKTDIAKFTAQYGALTIKESSAFHDRFLILDDKELYLIGASLKDLGKKCFGFTKMDASEIAGIKARVG